MLSFSMCGVVGITGVNCILLFYELKCSFLVLSASPSVEERVVVAGGK